MQLLVLVGLLAFTLSSELGKEAPEELQLPPNYFSILNLTAWERITQSTTFLLTAPSLAEKKFEHTICNDFVFGEIGSIIPVRDNNKVYLFSDIDKYKKAREGESFSGYKLCYYGTYHVSGLPRIGCILSVSQVCNNYSSCLTDECNCGSETFLCADGDGCISLEQVCDGRANCKDSSDECVCQDFLTCKKLHSFNQSLAQCFVQPDCLEANYTAEKFYNDLKTGKLTENVGPISLDPKKVRQCIMDKTSRSIGSHCKRINLHWKEINYPTYKCKNQSDDQNDNIQCVNSNEGRRKMVFCDGIQHCENGIDEQDCPDTFYCKSDNKPIPINMACDSVSDCSDSSDECNNCTASSFLSSQDNLISGRVLPYVVAIQMACIMVLNSYAIYYHLTTYDSSAKAAFKVDKIQCTVLGGYDLLIAVYLATIVAANFVYDGKYCLVDVNWRSSIVCRFAGTILFAASQGALQVAVAMSICRCFTCLNGLSGREITMFGFLAVFPLVNCVNIARAFAPFLAATTVLSEWSEIFIHEHLFAGNPLITRGKKLDLARMVTAYKRISFNETSSMSTKKLLQELSSMTSNGGIFAPDRITSIGFYGKSSMCYPDLFTNERVMLGYKMFYIVESCLYLLIIMTCYTLICHQFIKSRAKTRPTNRAENESNDQVFFLSLKISLVIGSQLVCWIPVNVAIIGSFFDWSIPFLDTDTLIGIVVPINSFLNPLIHCKPIFDWVMGKIVILKRNLVSWKNSSRNDNSVVQMEMKDRTIVAEPDKDLGSAI